MTFAKKRIKLDQKTLSEIKRIRAELAKAEEIDESYINELHKLYNPLPTLEDIEEVKGDIKELSDEYFRKSDVYYVDNLEADNNYSSFNFYIVNKAPFKNDFLFGRLSAFIADLCCECLPLQFSVQVLPEDYQSNSHYSYLIEEMQKAIKL